MKYFVKISRVIIWLAVIVCFAGAARAELAISDQVFDFGHVGIDFKIWHRYWIANTGDDTVKITNLDVKCDCSKVSLSSRLLAPGDTAFMTLSFETKNFYGPTSRSFTISTDDPQVPELQFFYLSIIGQWFSGLKPNPISLFFLPVSTEKSLSVPNRNFQDISWKIVESFDNTFTLKPAAQTASRGKHLEYRIAPREDLSKGTYLSSFTVSIDTRDESDPTVMTIPVKIVRY